MDSDSSQNTMTASGIENLAADLPHGRIVTQIKRSDWSAPCADITWTSREGHEPNWFHRKMQELCFGIKWRKK